MVGGLFEMVFGERTYLIPAKGKHFIKP